MYCTIKPSGIIGRVQAPASKSCMQRALAAALLFNGKTILHHIDNSADSTAAMEVIKTLGATVLPTAKHDLEILSSGYKGNESLLIKDDLLLNCGESGLAFRMFAAIAALFDKEILLHATDSLRNRPMHFFDEIFPLLNVSIQSANGYAPLQIHGPLIPRNLSLTQMESSQFLTGLLLAFSAANAREISISIDTLPGKGYIELTLAIMKNFGMHLPIWKNAQQFYFPGPGEPTALREINYTIEGDWSGAAFLLVAGALAGEISVTGLSLSSPQPDKAILEALQSAGANILIEADVITVKKSALRNFSFDATSAPDQFPPLAALAALCTGTSTIRGIHRLIHKESNRATVIRDELTKLGIPVKLIGDTMAIQGGGRIAPALMQTHNDHRIAMMNSLLALCAHGPVSFDKAEVVQKSYPSFYTDMQSLGAAIALS